MLDLFRNRWLRIATISGAIYFGTGWYNGWQYLYRFLMQNGVYSWLCDDCHALHPGWDQVLEICRSTDEDLLYVCMEQENAVQALYTMMTSSEFCGGIVAGVLYDMVGYRMSFLLGYLLNLFGLYGITYSTRSAQLYIPASICAGLSVNIIAFPCYYITHFFPGRESFAINLNSATQWACSSIFMIMWNMSVDHGYTMRQMVPVFTCIGLPFAAIFLLTVPKDRRAVKNEVRALGLPTENERKDPSFKDAFKVYQQWDIPVFAFLVYLPIVLANNAYSTSINVLAGADASLFLGQIQVWQWTVDVAIALWGLLGTGWFVFWNPFAWVWVGSITGLLSLIVGADVPAWTKTASVLFIIGNTFVYTQKYVFCMKFVDRALYGMVAGMMATCAGALNLTQIYWRKLAIDNGGDAGLKGFVTGYFVVAILTGVMALLIFWRATRGKIDHLRYVVSEPLPGDLLLGHLASKSNVPGSDHEYDYEYYYKELAVASESHV